MRGLSTGAALCVALAIPPAACAQGEASGDARAVESYRLTMPVLRKVLPALYQSEARLCEKKNEGMDPSRMSLAEITAKLEDCEPIRDAVRRSGVSTREAALTLAALVRASRRSADEESARAAGGQVQPLGPGVLKDNMQLIRENEDELGRLTRSDDQGRGS